MDSIIVYGPPGCGKSQNIERLSAKFELKNFIDHYEGDGGDLPLFHFLILCNCELPNTSITQIPFSEAVSLCA